MKRETRTDFQVWSAIGMLVAGVALSVAGFCVPPVGEISDSVLWFFAQCLIYAGSIFGVSIYVQSKFSDIKERLTEIVSSLMPNASKEYISDIVNQDKTTSHEKD